MYFFLQIERQNFNTKKSNTLEGGLFCSSFVLIFYSLFYFESIIQIQKKIRFLPVAQCRLSRRTLLRSKGRRILGDPVRATAEEAESREAVPFERV